MKSHIFIELQDGEVYSRVAFDPDYDLKEWKSYIEKSYMLPGNDLDFGEDDEFPARVIHTNQVRTFWFERF